MSAEFAFRVLDAVNEHPDATPAESAKDLGCSPRDIFLALRLIAQLAEQCGKGMVS